MRNRSQTRLMFSSSSASNRSRAYKLLIGVHKRCPFDGWFLATKDNLRSGHRLGTGQPGSPSVCSSPAKNSKGFNPMNASIVERARNSMTVKLINFFLSLLTVVFIRR